MALNTLADGFTFLEGPRWRDGKLWFSDMHDYQVFSIVPGQKAEPVCEISGRPSGLGWLPNGDLLIASMMDRKLIRQSADGTLSTHADVSDLAPKRINDMVVDAKGRAYVGNFGFDFDAGEAPTSTVLIRVDPDGSKHIVADGMSFPNGPVITPDGKTLIIAETFATQLTAFDISTDGLLSNRRVWAALKDGVVPDGICLDAAGAVWVASPTTGTCIRVAEGGEILETIDTGRQTIACELGGEDGRTLFILTAASTDHDQCRAERSARIEAAQVEVPAARIAQ